MGDSLVVREKINKLSSHEGFDAIWYQKNYQMPEAIRYLDPERKNRGRVSDIERRLARMTVLEDPIHPSGAASNLRVYAIGRHSRNSAESNRFACLAGTPYQAQFYFKWESPRIAAGDIVEEEILEQLSARDKKRWVIETL
jgi:hypothetical protein